MLFFFFVFKTDDVLIEFRRLLVCITSRGQTCLSAVASAPRRGHSRRVVIMQPASPAEDTFHPTIRTQQSSIPTPVYGRSYMKFGRADRFGESFALNDARNSQRIPAKPYRRRRTVPVC